MSTKFETLKREYDMEKTAMECERVAVSYHPLMHDSENAVQTAAIHLTVANENIQKWHFWPFLP